MRCDQARRLFDAYLDGELSPALATELGAHRVHCANCRRELALLEVSGQIIASDRGEAGLAEDFSTRLLACMAKPQRAWRDMVRQGLYYGGPLAAAAVIALAFVGVFDRGSGAEVRGLIVNNQAVRHVPPNESTESTRTPMSSDAQAQKKLEAWLEKARKSSEARLQSVESLQQHFDLTIGQWLDILEKANDANSPEDHFPGAGAADESTQN